MCLVLSLLIANVMTVLDAGFAGLSATRGPSTQQGTARSIRAPHAPSRERPRPPSLGRLPETAAVSIPFLLANLNNLTCKSENVCVQIKHVGLFFLMSAFDMFIHLL